MMKEPIGPVEGLKMALSKEIEAMELYRKLALEYPTARDIFTFLGDEEHKHKVLIEKKITELTS